MKAHVCIAYSMSCRYFENTKTHTVKPKCTAINVKRVENIRRRCIEACDDLDFAEIPARIEGDGIWRFDVHHILFVNGSRRKRGELQADGDTQRPKNRRTCPASCHPTCAPPALTLLVILAKSSITLRSAASAGSSSSSSSRCQYLYFCASKASPFVLVKQTTVSHQHTPAQTHSQTNPQAFAHMHHSPAPQHISHTCT